MDKKFLAVVAVALASVTAAGVGSYLAVRERAGSAPAASVAPAAQALAPAVSETEAPLSGETGIPAEAGRPAVAPEPAAGPVSPTAAPASPKPGSTASRSSRTTDRPAASSANTRTRLPRRAEPAGTAATAKVVPPAAERPSEGAESPEGRAARPGEPSEAISTVDSRGPLAAPRPSAETVAPAVPPAPTYEELVVPADAVIGLQVDSTINTERARVEDPVSARITRDVRVGGRVAIPAGSRVHGTVTLVERGGKIKDRARLGVRFHTLVLADGTRTPLATETLYREGESVGRSSAAKIGGGAVGGAIIGAILGGGKGAAIGAATGAGGGTAAAMAGDRKPATLPAGSSVTVRLNAPVTVTVEQTSRDPRDR